VAAGSRQPDEAAWFTSPGQVSQRRYEALRAYFVDGLSYAEAGERLGYTRWAMINLVREHRAGKLELFAPARKPGPPPGTAPARDAARGRVIELRRQGLSTYEISARLAARGTPLNRTGVGEILAEEGFGRLIRHPEPAESVSAATPGRDTTLPRAAVLDLDAWPERLDTVRAGLLLVLPDLAALDLPALIKAAGYPGTTVIPAVSWLLSLLALKLTRTRRVSHVHDLLSDPAAALLAGMAVLPEKSALTDYSYRLSHDHQQRFLAALDAKMIASGLAASDQAIFDLDFHAVMHWGRDPALEKHYVPTRSQRARSVLTFFARDSGTHNLVYGNADISKATRAREVIAFCDHWKQVSGKDPAMLVMDQKVTTQPVLGELSERGVKFLTLRMRSPALIRHISSLQPADFKTITLDRPGPHNKPKVHEDPAAQCTQRSLPSTRSPVSSNPATPATATSAAACPGRPTTAACWNSATSSPAAPQAQRSAPAPPPAHPAPGPAHPAPRPDPRAATSPARRAPHRQDHHERRAHPDTTGHRSITTGNHHRPACRSCRRTSHRAWPT